MLIELMKADGKEFYLADSRCENRESVAAELKRIKPTHVLNAAGVVCESKYVLATLMRSFYLFTSSNLHSAPLGSDTVMS